MIIVPLTGRGESGTMKVGGAYFSNRLHFIIGAASRTRDVHAPIPYIII